MDWESYEIKWLRLKSFLPTKLSFSIIVKEKYSQKRKGLENMLLTYHCWKYFNKYLVQLTKRSLKFNNTRLVLVWKGWWTALLYYQWTEIPSFQGAWEELLPLHTTSEWIGCAFWPPWHVSVGTVFAYMPMYVTVKNTPFISKEKTAVKHTKIMSWIEGVRVMLLLSTCLFSVFTLMSMSDFQNKNENILYISLKEKTTRELSLSALRQWFSRCYFYTSNISSI